MLKITDKYVFNYKVRFIETEEGYTAHVYTDYGWYELPYYYASKTKCRKALWYYCINHYYN